MCPKRAFNCTLGAALIFLGLAKTKCFTQSTFVVIGTDRDRKTGALRALLAHKDSAGLSYAGAATRRRNRRQRA
jgi:hypothetical protein